MIVLMLMMFGENMIRRRRGKGNSNFYCDPAGKTRVFIYLGVGMDTVCNVCL